MSSTSHGIDWSTSLCKSSIAGALSLSINTITNDRATINGDLSSAITCSKTRSVVEESDFELLHITAALIAIIRNAKFPSNYCNNKYVEDDVTSRALGCDASIPTCRLANHAGDIIGDNSLSGIGLAAPVQVTSCLSPLEMFHHHEDENIQETRPDPEEMVGDTGTRTSALTKGQLVWDLVRDNDILRDFYRNRQNLVLDSICPEFTPHVVVTPAEEAWNDDSIPWQNRVDFQEAVYLMVPPCAMFPDYCPSVGSHLSYAAPADSLQTSAGIIPLSGEPKTVFSASLFNKHMEYTSIERLVLHQIVRTLQKRRCRIAFFEASNLAITFRKRYDSSPNCFHAIERPYVWPDPAEPILLLSHGLLGTTIIDSHSPFSVPHIIINAPPPEDPWVPWNNATNNPQDHGYGRFLIVPSPSVGVINTVEYWEADSLSDSSSSGQTGLTVDPSESSRSGTPAPGTRMDDINYDFFVVRLEADIDGDMDSFDNTGLNVVPNSYALPCVPDPPRLGTPRQIFSIEEDEDDLPPFDDWYKC